MLSRPFPCNSNNQPCLRSNPDWGLPGRCVPRPVECGSVPLRGKVSDEVAAATERRRLIPAVARLPAWLMADGCLAVGCCFMASLVVEAYLRRFVRPSHAQGRDYIHMYIYTICSCRAHTHILYFRRWETSRVPRSLCGWTTKTRNRVKIYVLYMKIETNEKADSKSKGKTAGWHLFTFFGCWFSYFHSLPPPLAVAARCRWISLLAVELWELLVAVVSSHFLLLLGFASSIATSLSFGVLASWRLFPCYFVGFFIFSLVLFWSD